MGISREQFQTFIDNMSHRRRSSTLAEVANAAVFLASDMASGMTGTVANLTGGAIVDSPDQRHCHRSSWLNAQKRDEFR